MAFPNKKIRLRKWITQHLTGVGKTENFNENLLINKKEIKSILVTRPNHRLGNLLLITPLLQELENTFPTSKIDVFLKGGLGPIVLEEYQNIDRIIALPRDHFRQLPSYIVTWFRLRQKKYDLVINAVPHSSSGRLSTKLSRAHYKIFGDEVHNYQYITQNYTHIAKLPVCYLRHTLSGKQDPSTTEIPILDLKLTSDELASGKEILTRLTHGSPKTLAIFTYATGDKCYPKSWWKEFYTALQHAFPNHFILEILPKENVSQIDFAAPTYYSKDLREICSVLANTSGFIGADSGMMHLAVASKIPVIGLFCITSPEKYQPYGQQNFAINTTETSIAESIQLIKNNLLSV